MPQHLNMNQPECRENLLRNPQTLSTVSTGACGAHLCADDGSVAFQPGPVHTPLQPGMPQHLGAREPLVRVLSQQAPQQVPGLWGDLGGLCPGIIPASLRSQVCSGQECGNRSLVLRGLLKAVL